MNSRCSSLKTATGTYKFLKTASTTVGDANYAVTASKCVQLLDLYDVYLEWDANKNYSVVTTETGELLVSTPVAP